MVALDGPGWGNWEARVAVGAAEYLVERVMFAISYGGEGRIRTLIGFLEFASYR
jgi:hypothetical protein